MAFAALATVTDLTDRGIAVADEDRAELYLGVASEAVRDAAGCPISSVSSTVGLFADGCGPWLRLPSPPVTAVTSVELDGEEVTDFTRVESALYRSCGWQPAGDTPAPVTVTYTHGLPDVPADIVDLVCRMAAAALSAATAEDDGSGLAVREVRSERLGDYSVTYDDESGVTEMELSDRTRSRLAVRFGGGAAVVTVGRFG